MSVPVMRHDDFRVRVGASMVDGHPGRFSRPLDTLHRDFRISLYVASTYEHPRMVDQAQIPRLIINGERDKPTPLTINHDMLEGDSP